VHRENEREIVTEKLWTALGIPRLEHANTTHLPRNEALAVLRKVTGCWLDEHTYREKEVVT
jgi:hypothetical protein